MKIFLYSLIHTTEPFEFIYHWNRYGDIFGDISKNYKLIASSEKYNKSVIYPTGLSDIIDQKNSDFVPYFKNNKNIFALDTDIINTMLDNLDAQILYDHSIMLDTNK